MSTMPLRVLVSRPRPQGKALCAALSARGFKPIFLPVIEIKPVVTDLLKERIRQLDRYAWVIFVSPHAATIGARLIQQQWPQFPATVKIAAIGEGTAKRLQQLQLSVDIYPSRWNSEGFLALPMFQCLSGQAIAIFCGQGGRELLATTLAARGATIDSIVVYQRLLPQQDTSAYKTMIKQGDIDAILCTSVQSLKHLQILFTLPALKKIPLVLISERIMIQARAQGFEHCILAKDVSVDSIIQAMNVISGASP